MKRILPVIAVLSLAAWAQLPTQVVVTAMASGKGGLAPVAMSQVGVRQDGHPVPITSWQAATGANAGMEVTILLDDDTRGLAGPPLDDLKTFVRGLPPAAGIALAYMHTGTVAMLVPRNRDEAVSEMHQPSGASSPSPYGSLMALLAKWGRRPGVRRIIIMISDGEEHIGGNNASNETFQKALGDAVLSGVVVYPIFAQGSTENIAPGIAGAAVGASQVGMGAFNNAQLDTNAGLQNLSLLAEATGGEAYSQGNDTPTRLSSFLDQINARLGAQYLLAFRTLPANHRGLAGLKVEIHNTKARITAPKQVWAEAKH